MLCFSIQRVTPNLSSQALRNGCCGTSSRHSRIMLGSCSNRPSIVTRVFTCFLCAVLQLLDGFRTVNVTASVAGGWAVAGISLRFAVSGSFPQCKWHFHVRLDHVFQLHFWRKSRRMVSFCWRSQRALWKEVSYEMKCFSIQRVTPNLSSQALRNGCCGTSSRHSRIMLGSCSNRPSIVTRVFTCFSCTCC